MENPIIIARKIEGHRDGFIVKCLICGDEFYRCKSDVAKGSGRYCSKKCADKAQSKKKKGKRKSQRVTFICKNCGTKVEILKSEYENRYRITGVYPKYCSTQCSNKHLAVSGKDNPSWSRIKCMCQFCGKEFYETPSRIADNRGKFCSKTCLAKSKTGERNGSWKGGISKNPYPVEFNEELREHIRKRDTYICQVCGVHQDKLLIDEWGRKRGLDIHHIDYQKTNNNWDNLVSLCANCHGKTGTNRKFWANLLKVKIYNLHSGYNAGEQLELF